MFGADGEDWQNCLRNRLAWLKTLLKSSIYACPGNLVGVYPGKSEIFFVELLRGGDGWRIGRQAEEQWQKPSEFREMVKLLSERTGLRLAREGWEETALSVCLPEKECFCHLLDISSEIPLPEQKTAAYWEMDRFLHDCGLSQEMVSCTCVSLPEEDGLMEAVALEKEKAAFMQAAFKERGCALQGIYPETPVLVECAPSAGGWKIGTKLIAGPKGEETAAPDEQRRSVYAAAALAGLGGAGWPDNLLEGSHEKNAWNYEGMGKLAAALMVSVAVAWLGLDLGSLYLASREADDARQQLAEVEPARQTMNAHKRMAAAAEAKEMRLSRLTENSRPLDSLLIHLGTVTVEGAWLTEVDCTEEKVMHIRGKAVDYSALGEFLGAFEKDREFFTSVPVLEESRQQEGLVEFRLKMEMGI